MRQDYNGKVNIYSWLRLSIAHACIWFEGRSCQKNANGQSSDFSHFHAGYWIYRHNYLNIDCTKSTGTIRSVFSFFSQQLIKNSFLMAWPLLPSCGEASGSLNSCYRSYYQVSIQCRTGTYRSLFSTVTPSLPQYPSLKASGLLITDHIWPCG